ncbi:hypothetical protein AGLY_013987, partial [Aphis glycines]
MLQLQTMGMVSDVKVNILVFKKIEKNKKKNDGKTGIFTQNQFSTESIFLYGCNSKTNHCKYLKFLPNVYTTEIFDFYANFFLKCRSNFYEICRKRENLQVILNFENLVQGSPYIFLQISIKKTLPDFEFRQKIFMSPQTIFDICYYSKSISRRYLKFYHVDKIFLALSKYLKILYKVPHISKFIKLFVFISNVKKFNTKFSISFASKSYRDNLKRHYRKNVLSTDKSSPFRIFKFLRNLSKTRKFANCQIHQTP